MDEEEDVIPLPNVNSAILKKVIQWATHHKDDPPPPEDDENREKNTNDISSWDQDFLKVDQGTLFELILVGNFSFIFCFKTLFFFLGCELSRYQRFT
jgi:S-phase kinase-associated protein 1